MKRDLVSSVLAMVVLTVVLGLAYPLATTGVAQLLWPNKSDGSPVRSDGRLAGSKILGQGFTKPVLARNGKPRKDSDGNPVVAPDKRYFQARPSDTTYSAEVTFFGNLGPNSKELSQTFRENLSAYLALERPFDRGLGRGDVPADAVTTSASGVDPQISPRNARVQAHRIAAVRHMPMARVRDLISRYTDGRGLGLFGEPGVNLVQLNMALDRERT
jgi:K+-transporting ATPase ATPase C chain